MESDISEVGELLCSIEEAIECLMECQCTAEQNIKVAEEVLASLLGACEDVKRHLVYHYEGCPVAIHCQYCNNNNNCNFYKGYNRENEELAKLSDVSQWLFIARDRIATILDIVQLIQGYLAELEDVLGLGEDEE